MAKASEEISKYNSNSGGKTDSNLANDSNHLGGIPAKEYATQEYVHNYHEAKEAIQKEYIDKQDEAKLQEAKAYADQVVDGQDFSPFAKLTDVQAVDTKLSDKITQETTNQKNYTDQKTKEIVNDVNNNFDDVHSAISNLKGNQDSLFQSVSNGKAKIAGAITDKGVATSANDSFDTMAGNIKSIPTGSSGSADPNYVNTSDATATASDILVGKTAYAQGNKIYGTLIAQAETGMPTYGTDTSNATATENDIAYGKTAYARGQLLVGNAYGNEIKEIYGLSDEPFTVKTGSTRLIKETDDDNTIIGRVNMAFSKENNFCVSQAFTSESNVTTGTDFFIDSNPVDENGLLVYASSGVTSDEVKIKKYRYTKSELGLSENEKVRSINFGGRGFTGDNNICLLLISTYLVVDGVTSFFFHFYTYNLRENGVIGKMYDNQQYVLSNYTVDVSQYEDIRENNLKCIVFANNNPNVFYAVGWTADSSMDNYGYVIRQFKILYSLNNDGEINATLSASNAIRIPSTLNECYSLYLENINMSSDDKYITINGKMESNRGMYPLLIKIKDDYDIEASGILENSFKVPSVLMLNGTSKMIVVGLGNATDGYIKICIYNISILNSNITFTLDKTVNAKYSDTNIHVPIGSAFISADNSKIFILCGQYNSVNNNYSKDATIAIFDINTILNASNADAILPIQTSNLFEGSFKMGDVKYNNNISLTNIKIFTEANCNTKVTQLKSLYTTEDTENIIGIYYKNKCFYNISQGELTAEQSDVRKEKIFIGINGIPETGTMEVSE